MHPFIGYFSRLIVNRQGSRCVTQELDFVSGMHALPGSCVAAYVGHITAPTTRAHVKSKTTCWTLQLAEQRGSEGLLP